MIFLDISSLAIASVFGNLKALEGETLNMEYFRIFVLDSIGQINRRHRSKYGQLVICCDSKKQSWRKDIFKYYKANRKALRKDSPVDWNDLFEYLEKMIIELRENFPYKVIQFEGAEADDIIAVIAMHTDEESVIVSSDHDFFQLQRYGHIVQFDPKSAVNDFLHDPYPEESLRHKILKGDRGDCIPNINSEENSLADKIRQKSVTQAMLDKWLKAPEDELFADPEFDKERYLLNKRLIDFREIPPEIRKPIIQLFEDYQYPERVDLLDYFMEHALKTLIEDIGDF